MDNVNKVYKMLDLLRGNITIDCLLFSQMIDEKMKTGTFNSSKFLKDSADLDILDNELNQLSNQEIEELFFIILRNSKIDESYIFPEGEKLIALIIQKMTENTGSILDIGSGYGNFINHLYKEQIGDVYHGEEINSNSLNISEVLFKLRGIDKVLIKQQDALLNWQDSQKFDVVYCNMPFLGNMPFEIKNIFDEVKKYPLSKVRNTDWFFNFRVLDSIKEKGIGFSIVRSSALNGNRDEEIRKYFIENKKIKAVIKLPSNLLEYTMIPTNLLIFTNENNEKVKFIDASSKFVNLNRRKNGFSEENLEDIVESLFKDNEIAKTVNIEEIQKEDYDLSPELYLNNFEDKLTNPKELSELATIIRGRNFDKRDLDDDASKPQVGYLLNIGDFQDSIILQCKQSISEELIDNNHKILIQDKDLLLISRGPSIKLAIADKELAEKNVIVSTNITIIRPNIENINPYYLFAYLKSEIGMKMLKRISTGTSLYSISNKKLNGLLVPMLSVSEQEIIADEMNISLSDYKRVLKNLERCQETLPLIFNKFSSGGE